MFGDSSKLGRVRVLSTIAFFTVLLLVVTIISCAIVITQSETVYPDRIGGGVIYDSTVGFRNPSESITPEYKKKSGEYHARIQGFLGGGECEAKFFVRWTGDTELYGEKEFSAIADLFHAHPKTCLVVLTTVRQTWYKDILKQIADSGFRVLPIPLETHFLLDNTPARSLYYDLLNNRKYYPQARLNQQTISKLIWSAVLYKYGGVYLGADFGWIV